MRAAVPLLHCLPTFPAQYTKRSDVPWTLRSLWVTLRTDRTHTFGYVNTLSQCEVTWVTQRRQHRHQRVVMGVLVRELVLTSVSVLTSPYALNSSLAMHIHTKTLAHPHTHTNHAASWQLNLLEMTRHVRTSAGTVMKIYNTATHAATCTFATYAQFICFWTISRAISPSMPPGLGSIPECGSEPEEKRCGSQLMMWSWGKGHPWLWSRVA